MRDEIADHPELGEESQNGGSTAPTTNAGTPLPSALSGKLKLNFNTNKLANGGSSGVHSDED